VRETSKPGVIWINAKMEGETKSLVARGYKRGKKKISGKTRGHREENPTNQGGDDSLEAKRKLKLEKGEGEEKKKRKAGHWQKPTEVGKGRDDGPGMEVIEGQKEIAAQKPVKIVTKRRGHERPETSKKERGEMNRNHVSIMVKGVLGHQERRLRKGIQPWAKKVEILLVKEKKNHQQRSGGSEL